MYRRPEAALQQHTTKLSLFVVGCESADKHSGYSVSDSHVSVSKETDEHRCEARHFAQQSEEQRDGAIGEKGS